MAAAQLAVADELDPRRRAQPIINENSGVVAIAQGLDRRLRIVETGQLVFAPRQGERQEIPKNLMKIRVVVDQHEPWIGADHDVATGRTETSDQ